MLQEKFLSSKDRFSAEKQTSVVHKIDREDGQYS